MTTTTNLPHMPNKNREVGVYGILLLLALALAVFGCGLGIMNGLPGGPPPGRLCSTTRDCDCYAAMAGKWVKLECEPAPGPSDPPPSTTPSQPPPTQPSAPPPSAPPSSPPPSPCVPTTTVTPVCPGQCWTCTERLEWDVARGNLTVLPGGKIFQRTAVGAKCIGGSPLCYNDPGNDPSKREYIDRNCNLVRLDGTILRTAAQQFGQGCEGNQLCPPDRVVTTPCTTPTPGPSSPPPSPGGPVNCADIVLCGIGAQVHQFQNRQSQTVPYHREGVDGWIYVPNGPVIGGKVQTDQTPYYKPRMNPPGGCGSRFSCNGEGGYWGEQGLSCVHCERPGTWQQVGGPALGWELYNNNFGVEATLTQPGFYEFRVCGDGGACKVIGFRIEN